VGGLSFECIQCGRCCSGPGEGYIWVAKAQIEMIADFLQMTVRELRRRFLRRVGLRVTIIERANTKDCTFLQNGPLPRLASPALASPQVRAGDAGACPGRRRCTIYPVRPNQCRTWPFWPNNLSSIDAWNRAAQKCPGINRGRTYSYDEIERIKKSKRWRQDPR